MDQGSWVSIALSLLSAILGAVVGGLVVHRLALVRDITGARRTRRVEYLVEAYRVLIDAANRDGGMTPDQEARFEAAISDVVLLGEQDEIDAARTFMIEMAGPRSANLDPLIVALRLSLRAELQLAPLPLPNPYNLRIIHQGTRPRRAGTT